MTALSNPFIQELESLDAADPPQASGPLAKALTQIAEGNAKGAERTLRKIVAKDPQNLKAQTHLTSVALDRDEIDTARSALAAALRIAPNEPRLHQLLGRLFAAQGRANEAIGAYASAISIKPDLESAHRGLAPLLFRQKRYEEARKSAAIAHQLAPEDLSILMLLADIESASKQSEAALAHLTKAIQLDPDNGDIARRLSETLLELGKSTEAAVWGNRARKLSPDDSRVALTYALALESVRQHREVVNVLDKAIYKDRMKPFEVAFAENLIARALTNLGERAEAVPHARRAIDNAPDDTTYGSTYCRTLVNVGRTDDALDYARDLARRIPDAPGAAIVLAYALRESGDLDRAGEIYSSVLDSPGKRSEAEFGMAMVRLAQGSYAEGLRHYEARLEPPIETIRPKPPLEMWDGTPDPDIRLVILREQGMGDEFQFCRFMGEAASRVGHVNYVTYPSMTRILAPALEGVEVSADSMTGRKSDSRKWRWLPLMSLPHVLGKERGDLAGAGAYLKAEPEAVTHWAGKIAGSGLKVGIAWQGNPTAQVESGRSIPLAAFSPLAELDGVELYSLQKTHGVDQLETVAFRDRITDFGEEFDAGPDAFIDTAAAMMNLDLVVTSDTSIAHLAGALGRPCWVVLQKRAEWRWGRIEETSCWYPETRLFRQEAAGDWDAPMRQVAQALRGKVGGRRYETRPPAPIPSGVC